MNSSDIHIPGYTIHSAIGHGGMASVYLATQESLNRKVAIKVLRNTAEAGIDERFVNEARFIAGLNSPHIITIYDISTLKSGDCYIAMEFVGGGDVTENLGRLEGPATILGLIRQIAEGLTVVHDNGIIHRDVKSTNILFRKDGTAVLTDFGIAKDLYGDSDLTQAGFSLGSPAYSSPEQAQCLPIDVTTDIYSLGVVLLELLLGYNPFKGDSHTSTAINHIQLPVPALPEAFDYLAPLLKRILAKRPDERYPSCRELIADIDRILESPDDAKRARRSWKLVLPIMGARWTALAGRHKAGSVESLKAVWTGKLKAMLDGKFTAAAVGGLKALLAGKYRAVPDVRFKAGLATGVTLLTLYFGVFHEGETEREVSRLLAQAEQSMAAGRYIAPEGNNARDFYRRVLLLDSTNYRAAQGLRAAEERQVDAYLEQGTRALASNRLRRPKGNNAWHYFRQALTIDANNQRAHTGIAEVIEAYVRLARADLLERDYKGANYYVDSGLGIAPSNETLLALQTELKQKQDWARERQLQRAREEERQRQRARELEKELERERNSERKHEQKPRTVRTTIRGVLDRLRSHMIGDR